MDFKSLSRPKPLDHNAMEEEEDFLVRRRHDSPPHSKRAKPILAPSAITAQANFNPFASAELPPLHVSLDSSYSFDEPQSLLSGSNMSFYTNHGEDDYDDDEEDGYDGEENNDADGRRFCLSRRFSSTMFFDQGRPCAPQTPKHQDMFDCSTPPSSGPKFFSSETPLPRVRHQASTTSQGSRFASEFETLGLLGSGSFGKVYRVKNKLDGCLYAVKMVKQKVQGKTGRERVLKEVYALSALVNNSDNLHVVRYFSSWIDVDDCLYIQTELCDTSLEAMLQQPMTLEFKVQPVAVEIFKQLLQGLKGLHLSNVVHLDIKPGNILFRAGTYKLGDLGHAAFGNMDTLPAPPPFPNSQSDAILAVARDFREGDARYMARELLNEDHTHLPKADIFSLAMAVYELFLTKVSRKLPSEGPEWVMVREPGFAFPEDIATQMSTDFKELILLMMHCEPAKRPTAEALLVTGGPGYLLGEGYRTNAVSEARMLFRKSSKNNMYKRSNTM
ncbi:hypothetical protein BASA81_005409 [Batrachochytrium salamandrivorans]|nr:hypothetical protein BASA81_005409 [Batrachochytrium salamandrivorans]